MTLLQREKENIELTAAFQSRFSYLVGQQGSIQRHTAEKSILAQ